MTSNPPPIFDPDLQRIVNEIVAETSAFMMRFGPVCNCSVGKMNVIVESATRYALRKAAPTLETYISKLEDTPVDIPDANEHPIFQETFGDPSIPDGLVDKFYIMNPSDEDLIPYGNQLQEGMVILLEHYGMRRELKETTDGANRALLYERNQWCRVIDLDLSTSSTQIRFTGVYHDGTKRRRQYNVDHSWLAKLDSMPNGEAAWVNKVKTAWKGEKGTDI